MKFNSIVFFEIKKLSRNLALWGIIAGLIVFSTVLFKWYLYQYVHQAQLALEQEGQVAGVGREVVKPFWGWALLMITLITPILSFWSIGLERARKQFEFYTLHRVSAITLVKAKWLALVSVITLCIAALAIIPASLLHLTNLDWGLALSGALTVWLCAILLFTLSFLISLWISNPVLSVLLSYVAILLFAFLPVLSFKPLVGFIENMSFLYHAHQLMNGRLLMGSLLYFVLLTILILSCSIVAAKNALNKSEVNL